MNTSEYRHLEKIEISRSPEELYGLVADVSRMGQWSPVCTGGAYDEDGEWFTGANAMGETTWETRCRAVVADLGHEFAFINHGLEGELKWSVGGSSSKASKVEAPWRRRAGKCSGITRTDSASTK
jgi:hypothetical protein